MSLTLFGTKSALAPGLTASFSSSGGTAPYVYSVQGGGPGGTIDPTTGLYTAPASVANASPFADTVVVTDDLGAKATASVLVGNAWMLFLEIIQRALNLDPQIMAFENQKWFEPTNSFKGMWVSLMFPSLKTIASGLHPVGAPVGPGGPSWETTEKWANFSGPVDIHIMSRDRSALNRKEELVMALTGPYSRFQQTANSFYIARVPLNIVDVSGVDGDAIPWHFVVTVVMQYGTSKIFSPDFYDTFGQAEIVVNQ